MAEIFHRSVGPTTQRQGVKPVGQKTTQEYRSGVNTVIIATTLFGSPLVQPLLLGIMLGCFFKRTLTFFLRGGVKPAVCSKEPNIFFPPRDLHQLMMWMLGDREWSPSKCF